MPEVRILKSRNATVEVIAYGEALFAPGGPAPDFLRRFSARVREFAAKEAPANKRPRWSHYGAPLKTTMRASTRTRRGIGGNGLFHIHAAVGSTAPHAYYVDQGTGVFAGNGPYEAKVLPPWTPGDPSLYEATWRPQGPSNGTFNSPRVAKVMIQGQEGQQFFDKALKRGFQSMRMRSFQVPGEGVSAISDVLRSVPAGITGFLGNTPPDAGFKASLTEWRAWRDSAWANYEGLGRGRGIGSRLQREYRDPIYERRDADIAARQAQVKAQQKAMKNAQARDLKKITDEADRQKKAKNLREEKERIEAEDLAKSIAKRKFDDLTAEANAYAKEIERLLDVDTSVRANTTKTAIQVSWVDGSGDQQSQIFRL